MWLCLLVVCLFWQMHTVHSVTVSTGPGCGRCTVSGSENTHVRMHEVAALLGQTHVVCHFCSLARMGVGSDLYCTISRACSSWSNSVGAGRVWARGRAKSEANNDATNTMKP
ncbi:unnamed protein product [Protopolystoma xenopodis]|uniref:Secreted protein n=1 Tax=Protopolystoma xenopodis TaxID=117903 RepID=A0A3S5B3M2_9PLAT|nr:unnamed protein product [Protopolystoma xenopodis]